MSYDDFEAVKHKVLETLALKPLSFAALEPHLTHLNYPGGVGRVVLQLIADRILYWTADRRIDTTKHTA